MTEKKDIYLKSDLKYSTKKTDYGQELSFYGGDGRVAETYSVFNYVESQKQKIMLGINKDPNIMTHSISAKAIGLGVGIDISQTFIDYSKGVVKLDAIVSDDNDD